MSVENEKHLRAIYSAKNPERKQRILLLYSKLGQTSEDCGQRAQIVRNDVLSQRRSSGKSLEAEALECQQKGLDAVQTALAVLADVLAAAAASSARHRRGQHAVGRNEPWHRVARQRHAYGAANEEMRGIK